MAIYGALLSTWNFFKDKKKLKVKIYTTKRHRFEGDTKETVTLEAANVGKVPITIESFGICFDNGEKWNMKPETWQDKKLNESDKFDYGILMQHFIKGLDKREPKFVWFTDTAGKMYKSDSNINRLINKKQ
ncbi:MAG: hypothetical protein ACP5N1_06235 [Candidatus Woesearchaeota archaeon]